MVDSINQAENPIREADRESIDRLFSLDPQFLTEQNILEIIEKLRSGRGTWIRQTEKKASSSKGGKKKLSSEEAKALLSSLDLKLF